MFFLFFISKSFKKRLLVVYISGNCGMLIKFPQTMRTGRREWDRAGEEFAMLASEVGLSDERVYCCLVMADYDLECNLELAEYFLTRKKGLLRRIMKGRQGGPTLCREK